MKVGTKSQYAILAMIDLRLHGADQPVSLSEISTRQRLSIQYLEQLFVKLRRAELVTSVRGVKGGYKLTRLPTEILVSDIIKAVDNPIKTTRCNPDSDIGCQGKRAKCLAHHLWQGLGDHIESYLSGHTLDDICKPKTGKAAA